MAESEICSNIVQNDSQQVPNCHTESYFGPIQQKSLGLWT